jgi:hypothetical protein
MDRSHVRSHPLVALSVTLLALPACDSCHASKPYTPYTLTDTPPSGSGSAQAPAADAAAAPAFSAIPAAPAPDGGARWTLGEGAVEPPAGHAFAQGLVVDVDGDGKPDLLAWARAPDGLRGELIFATSKAPAEARTISTLPEGLAASGCTAEASLSQIGPRMAAFVFEPRCPGRLRERASRWIAVLRFGVTPEIALELRTALPADGEQLAVGLDGRDRDGDGRGDVSFTFTLSGAPRPLAGGGSASAALAYFDRSAGLSRDPTEPEASLKALSASLVGAGRKKTTAPSVPGAALAARRLRAALCEDGGGHPLISTTAGPVRCGADQVVEQTLISEVEAAYNLADPVTAFAVAARLDALGQRRKDVDGLLAKLAPPVAGTLARTTGAVAVSVPASAFAPIAFDESGDLLVRTRDKVIRVDKASFAETTADPQPAWPRDLAFPEGDAPTWRLGAIEDGCEGAVVRGSFLLDGTPSVVPLPVLTPARCAEGTRAPVNLLGLGAQGFLVAVRGEILAIPAASPPKPVLADSFASAGPVPRGAARSPDGGTIAVSTTRGALVAAVKSGRSVSAKLWTGPQVDNAGPCVPANGGARLACVVKEGVAIYDAK